ncbi:MAG: hypothetical protein AMXMBFR33_35700 [Candidatus Xenobia bacterium]
MSESDYITAFHWFVGYVAALMFGLGHFKLWGFELKLNEEGALTALVMGIPALGAILAVVWYVVLFVIYAISRGAWLSAVSLGCPLTWWAWVGVEVALVVGLVLLVRARRRWEASRPAVAE